MGRSTAARSGTPAASGGEGEPAGPATAERSRRQRSRDLPAATRVGRSLARLSRILEQSATASGVSLAQYRVLVLVSEEPHRASALAAKVDVQRATLSTIVSGLERMGLLERASVAHDGRGVQLQLTALGRTTLRRVESVLTDRVAAAADTGEADAPRIADELDHLLAGFAELSTRRD